MIKLTRTLDNMFRITYINENGFESGYVSAEFTAKEIRTILRLNELYFNDIYGDDNLDTMSLGHAIKSILERGIISAANVEFEDLNTREQRIQGARAIYAHLTTKACEQFKDKLREHGYQT